MAGGPKEPATSSRSHQAIALYRYRELYLPTGHCRVELDRILDSPLSMQLPANDAFSAMRPKATSSACFDPQRGPIVCNEAGPLAPLRRTKQKKRLRSSALAASAPSVEAVVPREHRRENRHSTTSLAKAVIAYGHAFGLIGDSSAEARPKFHDCSSKRLMI